MSDSLQAVLKLALALSELDRLSEIEILQNSLDAKREEVELAWLPILEERSRRIEAAISIPKVPEVLRQHREKKRISRLG
jgi:hypothetical protein